MGLTIHYKLKSDAKSTDEARRFEHLEAGFERKNLEETDNMKRTARVIAALIGDATTGSL